MRFLGRASGNRELIQLGDGCCERLEVDVLVDRFQFSESTIVLLAPARDGYSHQISCSWDMIDNMYLN